MRARRIVGHSVMTVPATVIPTQPSTLTRECPSSRREWIASG